MQVAITKECHSHTTRSPIMHTGTRDPGEQYISRPYGSNIINGSSLFLNGKAMLARQHVGRRGVQTETPKNVNSTELLNNAAFAVRKENPPSATARLGIRLIRRRQQPLLAMSKWMPCWHERRMLTFPDSGWKSPELSECRD